MDYPDKDNPNKVYLLDSNDQAIYTSAHQEEGLESTNFIDAYLAYSPAATVSGQAVYVNYGTRADFELLSNQTGDYFTNVQGKICVARYGSIYRGNKAKNAQDAGCIGLLIFSDPADVAGEGQDPKDVYPNSMFLPDTGIQRGSLLLSDGDPETPNWPSLPGAYMLPEDEYAHFLPNIPCQPIGYRGAKEFLKYLSGKPVPEAWKGGLTGIDYTIGGSFNDNCQDCKIKIETHNHLERKLSPNVIGYIKGSVEPDRYVMVGNHRDAWGFGALDPSSGTASMLEVARVLGQKLKNGWRPRRTILFLSWGGEEFGLTGSREFVEEFKTKLVERGVIYINTDTAVSGPILGAEASPTIAHNVIDATKKIQYQDQTYYDFWKQWLDLKDSSEEPEIWMPGSGSDHASFIFHAGVPVMDFAFGPDTKEHPSLKNIGYPTYHTAYETFQLMETLIDPNFELLSLSTKMTLALVRDFAESLLLDFKLQDYNKIMNDFLEDQQLVKLEAIGISVNGLVEAIEKFNNATTEWNSRYIELYEDAKKSPFLARQFNDQMMNLDKNFLLADGLPARPIYSHAIMSPSQFNVYGSGYFPGIADTLYDFDNQLPEEKERRKKVLEKHVSDLMIVILRAANHLHEIHRL